MSVTLPVGYENLELGLDCHAADNVSGWHLLYRPGGVAIAVLKVGEGTELDPKFANRVTICESVGFFVMAYFFVRPDVDPAVQLASILKHVPEGMLCWLDLEPSLVDPNDPTSDRWLDIPIAARQKVLEEIVAGYKVERNSHPGFYCTKDFWENVLGAPDGYERCPWWGARYSVNPPQLARNLGPWVGWQWTASATLPGFDGSNNLDLSVWRPDFLAGIGKQ